MGMDTANRCGGRRYRWNRHGSAMVPEMKWTEFSTALFHMLEPELKRIRRARYGYQERVRIVKAMLESADAQIAVIEAEKVAGLPPPKC